MTTPTEDTPARAPHIGDRCSDSITGFEGIATGLAIYMTGPARLLLSAPVTATNGQLQEEWFDIDRLTLLNP